MWFDNNIGVRPSGEKKNDGEEQNVHAYYSVFMLSVRSSPDAFTNANRATAVSGRRASLLNVFDDENMTGAIKKEKKK